MSPLKELINSFSMISIIVENRLVWCCQGRACYNENNLKMYEDHICQALKLKKSYFITKFERKHSQTHHPARLIIEEVRLKFSQKVQFNYSTLKFDTSDLQMILLPFRSIHHQYVLFNVLDEIRIFYRRSWSSLYYMIYKIVVTNEKFWLYDNDRRLLIFASKQQFDCFK